MAAVGEGGSKGGTKAEAISAIVGVARNVGLLDDGPKKADSSGAKPKVAEPEDGQLALKKSGEKSAFAKFDAEFDTFKDASSARMSPDELKAMREAVEAIMVRVEAKKKQMLASGKKPDLDELAKEFDHIPRNFMPIQFKKELQDWRAARDAMLDRNVQKMFEGTDLLEAGKGGVEAFSTVVKIGEGANEKLEKYFDKKKVELAGTVLKDLGFVAEGVSGTLGMVKGLKGMADAEGPVQKKMASADTLDALKDLAGTGMDIATEFVPIVGAVKDGATCLANLKACYEHYKLQAETGELKDEAALDVISQLAKAFGQEEGRQDTLKKKSGVDAATNAISATGKALKDTVVGAKIGVPLLVVGKGISIGSTVYFKSVDWAAADKAQKVLAEARAGNEAAMQEVFAHHAAYAKMLIAIYAKNKNPLAIKYFVQRGLTEADLDDKATSMDILMEFGLKESKEDEAPKTFTQTLTDALAKVAAAAELAKKGVEALLVKVGAMEKTSPEALAQARSAPDVNITRAYRVDEIAAMARTLDQCRQTRKTVEREGDKVPVPVLRNIATLEAALKGIRDDTKKVYEGLMASKIRLAEIKANWVSEADEIKRGRKKPAIASLDPTPLIPIVEGQLAALQHDIDAALTAYEASTRVST